jgi:hypothetical protein
VVPPVPQLTVTGVQPLSEVAYIVDQGQPAAELFVPPTARPRPPELLPTAAQPALASADWLASVLADIVLRRVPPAIDWPSSSALQPLLDAAALIADQGQPVGAAPPPPFVRAPAIWWIPTTGSQPPAIAAAWITDQGQPTAPIVILAPVLSRPVAILGAGMQPLFETAAWIADQGQPVAQPIVLATRIPTIPLDAIAALQPRALAAWMVTPADIIVRSWPQPFSPLAVAPQPLFAAAAIIAGQSQPVALTMVPRIWAQPVPGLPVTGRQPIALPLAAWLVVAPILSTDGRVEMSGSPRTQLIATASARTVLDASGAPRTIIVIEARRVN